MSTPRRVLLTAAEEIALAKRVQHGDIEARNDLVERSMGLVNNIANLHPAQYRDDLCQEGALALMHAAELYDPVINCARFSTYASYWIRSRIQLWHHANHLVAVPEYVQRDKSKQLRHAAQALRSHVHFALRCAQQDQHDSDGRAQHPPTPVYPDPLEAIERKEAVEAAMKSLTPVEQWVITRRLDLDGEGKWTLKRTGKALGVTVKCVRIITARAIELLRERLSDSDFAPENCVTQNTATHCD